MTIVVGVVEHEHRGIELEQGVGSGVTRSTQTGDDDVYSRPVEQPVGRAQINLSGERHCPATHSA